MNKVVLIGKLGFDPEIITKGEFKIAKLRLVTSKGWKDKNGEKQEKSSWHNITFYGKTAGTCEDYCFKGNRIAVEGEIDYQTWDKDDGTKGYKTIITGISLELLGDNKHTQNQQKQQMIEPGDSDELPF